MFFFSILKDILLIVYCPSIHEDHSDLNLSPVLQKLCFSDLSQSKHKDVNWVVHSQKNIKDVKIPSSLLGEKNTKPTFMSFAFKTNSFEQKSNEICLRVLFVELCSHLYFVLSVYYFP